MLKLSSWFPKYMSMNPSPLGILRLIQIGKSSKQANKPYRRSANVGFGWFFGGEILNESNRMIFFETFVKMFNDGSRRNITKNHVNSMGNSSNSWLLAKKELEIKLKNLQNHWLLIYLTWEISLRFFPQGPVLGFPTANAAAGNWPKPSKRRRESRP